MKLLFSKQNYNVLSPSSYTNIYVRDLYISRICLSILLHPIMWTDPGNIKKRSQTLECGIGTEAAQFPEKEYMHKWDFPCSAAGEGEYVWLGDTRWMRRPA